MVPTMAMAITLAMIRFLLENLLLFLFEPAIEPS